MAAPKKVYCEHGALSARLKALKKEGKIELVHFPADLTRSKYLKASAVPSQVQFRDMGITFEEASFAWDEAVGSDKFDQIAAIVGHQNRRDALHVDSAYKTRCVCLVSEDKDILGVRDRLTELTGLRFFSSHEEALYAFLEESNRVAGSD